MKVSALNSASAINRQVQFKGNQKSVSENTPAEKGTDWKKWAAAGAAVTALVLGGIYLLKKKDSKPLEEAGEKLKDLAGKGTEVIEETVPEVVQRSSEQASETVSKAVSKAAEKSKQLAGDISNLSKLGGVQQNTEGLSIRQLKKLRKGMGLKLMEKSGGGNGTFAVLDKKADALNNGAMLKASQHVSEQSAAAKAAAAAKAESEKAAAFAKTAEGRHQAQIDTLTAQVKNLSDTTGVHADTYGKTTGQLRGDRRRLEKVLSRQTDAAYREQSAQRTMEEIENGMIPKAKALKGAEAKKPADIIAQMKSDFIVSSKKAGFDGVKVEHVPQPETAQPVIFKQQVSLQDAAPQPPKELRPSSAAARKRKSAAFQSKITKKAKNKAAGSAAELHAKTPAPKPQNAGAAVNQTSIKTVKPASGNTGSMPSFADFQQAQQRTLKEQQHTADLYAQALEAGRRPEQKVIYALPEKASSSQKAPDAPDIQKKTEEIIQRRNAGKNLGSSTPIELPAGNSKISADTAQVSEKKSVQQYILEKNEAESRRIADLAANNPEKLPKPKIQQASFPDIEGVQDRQLGKNWRSQVRKLFHIKKGETLAR